MRVCRVYFHGAWLPFALPVVCTYGGTLAPRLCNPNGYFYGHFKPAAYPLHVGDVWRSYRAINRLWDQTRAAVLNRGVPSHSLVEVTHTCCDFTSTRTAGGRSQGLWHYLQPGSGIWFNVGNTIFAYDSGENAAFASGHCIFTDVQVAHVVAQRALRLY